MQIKVITNDLLAGTADALDALRRAAARHGIGVALDTDGGEPDFYLALGGDGSVLRALQRIGETSVPLAGINIGNLGFLTCGGIGDIGRILGALKNGDYVTSVRSMLEARVCGGDTACRRATHSVAATHHALNDAVALRSDSGQTVQIALSVNGAPVAEFACDGMIVATPTGSTAYALSAGGPIMMPDAAAIGVIAVCPHSMTARPLVLPDTSIIELRVVRAHSPLSFNLDGQFAASLGPGDTASVRRSPRQARLVMLPGDTPFTVIARKLGWGG